jgi:SsrA-binding protein
MKEEKEQSIHIKNKRAYFDFLIDDKFVAGIKLLGTEIKSIRQGKANLLDSFCTFIDGNLYIRNLHISEYTHGSFYNHEAKRDRVLLLQKKELKKLKSRTEEKGFTIVPLTIFINARGFAKVEIGLAQGKKTFDKRESMKERDSKIEMDRVMKR